MKTRVSTCKPCTAFARGGGGRFPRASAGPCRSLIQKRLKGLSGSANRALVVGGRLDSFAVKCRMLLRRIVSRIAIVLAVTTGVALTPRLQGQSQQRTLPSAEKGDWVSYASDIKGTRYMPFDQINASNFSKLEVAWRFSTNNLGPRPEFNLQGTPLMIGGKLYATGGGGNRRAIVAIDAKTGELLWKHGVDEGARADEAPRKLSGRGLSYWTDGRGDERILYVTIGYRLVSLNAKTGQTDSLVR